MPSPLRDPVSRWLDLDYHKKEPWFRRLRRWLPWAALFGSAVAIAAFTRTHGESIYQAGPVASAHAFFNHDCKQCHTEAFQPLERFWKSDDNIRSVSDTACMKCHPGSLHQPTQTHTPSCTSCHREHQGKAQLARVADGHCLSCHGDLGAAHLDGKAQFKSFVSFAAHPEFDLWGRTSQDPGTIRFNHAKHLVDGGVLTILDPESPEQDRPRRRLECAECHKLDDAGQYMLPVKYEQHCKECHPLGVQVFGEWKEEAVKLAAREFKKEPAPHEAAAVVHAVLRDRYTRFSDQHGSPLGLPATPHPLPGRERKPEITSEEQWEWVQAQTVTMEKLLFQKPDAGCQYCHGAPVSLASDSLPLFQASSINTRLLLPAGPAHGFQSWHPDWTTRWLPHSRFSHESHRMLDCVACHKDTKTSVATSDVLLPKIADCKSCHNPQVGVRSDCVTCHTYHNQELNRQFRGKGTIVSHTGFDSTEPVLFLAPKGPNKSAQGNALGKPILSHSAALEGQNNGAPNSFIPPFQGSDSHAASVPRALPWDELSMPLRGGRTSTSIGSFRLGPTSIGPEAACPAKEGPWPSN